MNSDEKDLQAETPEEAQSPESIIPDSLTEEAIDPETEPTVELPTEPTLEEKFAELEDKLIRQAAEFENFKKRNLSEAQTRLKYANIGLLKDFLPGLDNLERAIEHATSQEHDSDALAKFVEGVEMVKNQFYEALKKNHVERFFPLGETFDPNLHEAVGMIESEQYQNDQVAVVMQAGYKQHDRVLRPAMVQVTRNN